MKKELNIRTKISLILGIPVLLLIVYLIVIYAGFYFAHKNHIYQNSFDLDLDSLEYLAPVQDDNGQWSRYIIDGKQFDQYIGYDIYGFAGKTDGRYLTEDMLTPGETLYYWINDDRGIFLFEIDGLPSDEWLMVCIDRGGGNYDWVAVLKEDSVEEIPQIIVDLGPPKRNI